VALRTADDAAVLNIVSIGNHNLRLPAVVDGGEGEGGSWVLGGSGCWDMVDLSTADLLPLFFVTPVCLLTCGLNLLPGP